MIANRIDFQSEEITQLLALFDNSSLLSGLRKVWAREREYWRDQGDAEALSSNPSVSKMIQCAARAAEISSSERVIREALGLKVPR